MVVTVVVLGAVELQTVVAEGPEELLKMVAEAKVQQLVPVVGRVGAPKQKVMVGMKKAKAGIDHALMDGRVVYLEPVVELQIVVDEEPEERLEMIVEAKVHDFEQVVGLPGVLKQKPMAEVAPPLIPLPLLVEVKGQE